MFSPTSMYVQWLREMSDSSWKCQTLVFSKGVLLTVARLYLRREKYALVWKEKYVFV